MSRSSAYSLLLCAIFLATGTAVRADRVLLAPSGETITPDSVGGSFLIAPDHGVGNYTWLQYGTPGGIELEGERTDLISDSMARYALNIQVPLLIELNGLPAVSIGVRDLFGTGENLRSFYAGVSKSFPLSRRQRRIVRDFRATLGFGTERMDGLFMGVEARLALGLNVTAELFRNRPNFGVDLPLIRGLQARVTSLNGSLFYGVTFRLNH